jgi:ADP-ribose pyrophosphatase
MIKDERSPDFKYTGPLNPMGKTRIIGRGLLGNYGPNFAADPIVTRLGDGVLEVAAIKRSDTGEWAIPGGMAAKGLKLLFR